MSLPPRDFHHFYTKRGSQTFTPHHLSSMGCDYPKELLSEVDVSSSERNLLKRLFFPVLSTGLSIWVSARSAASFFFTPANTQHQLSSPAGPWGKVSPEMRGCKPLLHFLHYFLTHMREITAIQCRYLERKERRKVGQFGEIRSFAIH